MSQDNISKKKKSNGAMKVVKENNYLDKKTMREVEKQNTRQNAQMRRAVNPIHSLRRCSMWCFSSYRRCLGLGAVEGALLLGPFRSLSVYLYVCLLWEQGRQAIIIRSIVQEFITLKSDSQKNLRQGRSSRGSVPEDSKNRTSRQIIPHVNSKGSLSDSGEPKTSSLAPPEKAPTPPEKHAVTPPPPPSHTPPPTSEMLKARLSQEWKNPKHSSSHSSKESSEDNDDDVSNWTPGRPRPPKPKQAITIAVSSRALFNMAEDNKIFEKEGLEKYMEYQLTHENVTLKPGPAFGFVKALQNVNARLRSLYPKEQDLFDIVLMTNNHAQVGVRIINSINHHDSDKVQEAIEEGIAAATMYLGNKDLPFLDTQLRVAFDGDAILFSDDFDQNSNKKESEKNVHHESTSFRKNKYLVQGPLKRFLEDLGRLQKKFYAKDERLLCPIRTYLITARSAANSGACVLKRLRTWGLEIDEALFLAGAPKGPILVKIRPHIFFNDDMFHIKEAQKYGTLVGNVSFPSLWRGSQNQEVEKK
ncbi:cytosolic 5'-nucleotidase 1B isoform X2 [Sarcophilus harrisii]|uniref:cytosolic 5'-nucleotidase 1B isoform X2 n=1 Tax=Sarcophilus harrisii TaxID=9305 RepID=UPI001301FD06|nr:cytosolic 5'-nucleotidase 1B isoform X2 [Sarcophilus harrisii]